ncbi:Cof-type HAD-IIB family hydrolase [Fictibacillus iocasae]|uniref:Cof-type HAD-IIB family hydrolase n=1 Tax=Fictibacillus iocasae TaxID=2715437 RepID=A0ABW2NVY5_9BACL
MNDKIVFFDIDGTLVNEEKKVPDSAKEALHKLRENGIHTAIATGRGPFMFTELRKELELDSFVSFNGSYVMFENDVIHKNPLNTEVLEKLEEEAVKNGHPLVYLDHKGATSNVSRHEIIEACTYNLMPSYPIHSPQYYKQNEVYQVLLFCEEKDEQPYKSGYSDTYGFIRWHEHCLDVLPYGGSKAKGIEVFVQKLGIKRENIFAFGDALNDLEMLAAAGTGVAMGNGLEQAKQTADYVTKSVDEDGIYHGLKHLGLI